MIEIKICGITNEKEIEYLNVLKPEYIGFVFTNSKRQITGIKAQTLVKKLNKSIKTVGVFKNSAINEILDTLNEINLDVIQLHGIEDEKFILSLKANINDNIKVWKAISIKDTENLKKYIANIKRMQIDNLIIDGDNPGSGETFSLDEINVVLPYEYNLNNENKQIVKNNNFFLAGGITPENVIERIEKVKPIGVDVSSGVEIIDVNGARTKSFDKMKTLIEAVRNLTD